MSEDVRLSWVRRVRLFLNAQDELPLEEIESESGLYHKQNAGSALTLRFCIVLALAAFIASLGLMVDSSATIIGAMLIAPLMRPILALAYGLTTLNWLMIARSVVTTSVGVLITVVVAIVCEYFFDLRGPTSELLSRTHPSLIDLGVAVAAGIAATMATNRPNVADSLPGVAIAVALVPPLCVTGLSLSNGHMEVAMGALMLFIINLIAIILSAVIVYVIDGYANLKSAIPGAISMILMLVMLSPGLQSSMQELSAEDKIQMEVVSYLSETYARGSDVHPNDLSRIITKVHDDHMSVFVELEAPAATFDHDKTGELYRRISGLFTVPVNLKVQTLVTEEVVIYPFRHGDGAEPRYGSDALVPRK